MKKVLSIFTVAFALLTILLSGCNNKPSFERLAAAVDSVNNENVLPSAEFVATQDHKAVTYDQWENVVTFNTSFPVVIEPDVFEPIANNVKERILTEIVKTNYFGIVNEIIDAKANILIDIHGLNDTKYEVMVPYDEIVAAFEADSHAEAFGLPMDNEEQSDSLTPAQIEHELLEGNAPSIGK